MNKPITSGFEKRKVSIDLLKHLATLSTAFVAVIAASLERLHRLDVNSSLVEVGVVSFLVCIVASIVAVLVLLAHIENLVEIVGTKRQTVLRVSTGLSILAFGIGVSCISVLVLRAVA